MVNYPNMKKTTIHQTKLIDGKLNTRHRGMNLEEDLNLTNKYYLTNASPIFTKSLHQFKS